MPDTLIRLALAAAIAGAAIPAWGAGMPEFGTKNFSPGGDTPSYFSNENGMRGAAAGETLDDGGEAAAGSLQTASYPDEPASTASRYLSRPIAGHGSRYRGTAYMRQGRHARATAAKEIRAEAMGANSRTMRYANAPSLPGKGRSSRTVGARSVRHAWARPASRKG